LHFTNKDVSGHALECNKEQRAIFMNHIADIVTDPNMLIFGDEAAKDEQTSAQNKDGYCGALNAFSKNASCVGISFPYCQS
jgi:hypothetical protein